MTGHPTLRSEDDQDVGLVILDDLDGLAPQVSGILRDAARRISGIRPHGRGPWQSHRSWPSVLVKCEVGLPDGALRPGRTSITIAKGPLMTPVLRISIQMVNGCRVLVTNRSEHLLRLAELVEGGAGVPDDRQLRAVAVASRICDDDPEHSEDMVVLHTATAFEEAYLYDEGRRGKGRTDPRVLTPRPHLRPMMQALPPITMTTLVRDVRGLPVLGIAPFADKARDAIDDADLELVRVRSA
jgi:hypothetical protein